MRTFYYAIPAVAALLTGCGGCSSDSASDPLSCYVVSGEKIAGGRFIDTPDFPKLGYIAAKPDLIVTRLEDVAPSRSFEHSGVKIDKDGNLTGSPQIREITGLRIELHPNDAKKFVAFTEQVIGKQVLFMIGDLPLSAPLVIVPITTEGFSLTFGENSDTNQIEYALKKLVR